MFVTMPFTGTCSDKIEQHEHTDSHQVAAASYREGQPRLALGATASQVLKEANTLTVDEEAFIDALKVMYFLNKHEIAYTTTFKHLKDLCELLWNDTLKRLCKAKNLNYESEMTMNEMVRAIGISLEIAILLEVKTSQYYSVILDEATDISVNKQLGLCIQYLTEGGFTKVRYVKLLEMKRGSAEVIAETTLQYLTSMAPVTLDLKCFTGGSSDAVSVMVGRHGGVMTRLQEATLQGFGSTHCVAHRQALAASDACKHIPMVLRFERIVNQIYTFSLKVLPMLLSFERCNGS